VTRVVDACRLAATLNRHDWFRTSDLGRVNAFGAVHGVSGSLVCAGHVVDAVHLVSTKTAGDGPFITKSITKQAFALSLPSPSQPNSGGRGIASRGDHHPAQERSRTAGIAGSYC
jgi:hypothetical protein